jgi:hypothetical protein
MLHTKHSKIHTTITPTYSMAKVLGPSMYNVKMNTMANTVPEGMNPIHKNTHEEANP